MDAHGTVVVVILYRDLAFRVGTQICHVAALAAYLGQHDQDVMGQAQRQRHIGVRLVVGISEHHSLVTGPLAHGVARTLHAAVDVGALFVDGTEDAAAVGIELIFGFRITDTADRAPGHFLQVGIRFRFHFSGNDHLSGRHERFASYFGVGVIGQQLVKHGIRYLIGYLVGVSFRHRFGCKQISHCSFLFGV